MLFGRLAARHRLGPVWCPAFRAAASRVSSAESAPLSGRGHAPAAFGAPQWTAVLFIGVFGAALNFYLWVWALERTMPTRVATTITVNPVSASILAAVILGELIGLNLVLGIGAVLCGIWVAAT
jgi:drug/metabolite transporter (DMT)-like permease